MQERHGDLGSIEAFALALFMGVICFFVIIILDPVGTVEDTMELMKISLTIGVMTLFLSKLGFSWLDKCQ